MVVLGCLVGFLVGEIVAGLFVGVGAAIAHFPGGFQGVAHASEPPWWANALSLVGLWSGFLGATLFAFGAGGLARIDAAWRVRLGDLRYVALGVAGQLVVDALYQPFHFTHLNQPVRHIFGASHSIGFFVLALMTTIGAPVAEEWFFRGVLYRALDEGLARVMPRVATVAAIVVSAALFALAHGEPLQFAGLALIGVVLAILVRRTRRLMPSIITHVSFNAVAMAVLVAQRSGH